MTNKKPSPNKGKTLEELYGNEKAKWMKERIRQARKKYPHPMKGKKHKQSTKDKISQSNKGKTAWNKGKTNIYNSKILQEWSKKRKGVKPWNKGIKCPQISNSVKGQIRESITGDKHPNWRGGKSFEPYNKDFNNIFRKMIRKRDKYICAICNKPSKQTLDVHHIDYNKLLSIKQNAISLCHSCHTKTNWNRKYWKTFFQSLLSDKYGYIYEDDMPVLEITINNTKT